MEDLKFKLKSEAHECSTAALGTNKQGCGRWISTPPTGGKGRDASWHSYTIAYHALKGHNIITFQLCDFLFIVTYGFQVWGFQGQ